MENNISQRDQQKSWWVKPLEKIGLGSLVKR
jgi:hypothetical protein